MTNEKYDELRYTSELADIDMPSRAAASAPKAELTDERAAFEAWAKKEGLIQESHGIRSVSSVCAVAEKAWQARAVLAQAAPVAVPSEPVATVYEQGGEKRISENYAALQELATGTELYASAAPLAAQQSPADARDAARWRFIVKDGKSIGGHFTLVECDANGDIKEYTGDRYNEVIDAAIAAATTSTEGR